MVCTVILPHKGGTGLAEGVHDVVGHDLDVQRSAGGGHDDGAQAVDGGLDDDVGDGEDGALDAGRQADAQDLPEAAPVDGEPLGVYVDVLVALPQSPVQNGGADHVGQHRGDGHAVDGHVKAQDEHQVEQHIQDTGGGQGDEGDLGFADAAEDGGFKVVEQDGGHAQEIDAQIEEGQGVDVLRHLQEGQ